MKIEIKDILSTSATKGQQNNAVILFGKRNAAKILKALEMYSKEKSLSTEGVDAVLDALKTKDVEKLEKFASSASGKKLASNVLRLANAKTPVAMFTALKTIKPNATLSKLGTVAKTPVKSTKKPVVENVPQRKSSTIKNQSSIDLKSMSDDQIKTLAKKTGSHSEELNSVLNGRSKPNKGILGYYRPDAKRGLSGLPFPVALNVKGYNKNAFINKLKKLQTKARKLTNKGTSPNRWTGAKNGAAEFTYTNQQGKKLTWPQGVYTYLRAGVPPNQEAYRFVTGKSLPSLPY